MRCFCTSSSFGCSHGQKECAPNVEHCFLNLKWSKDEDKYVVHIQGCWQWADKHACPEHIGPCHILQESEKQTKTCCCKGELCNKATDIQFATPAVHRGGLHTDVTFEQGVPINLSNSTPRQTSGENSNTGTLFSLVMPLGCLLLLIVFGSLLFQLCRNRLKSLHLKQHFRGSSLRRCNRCRSLKLSYTANSACEHSGDIPDEMQHMNGMLDSMKLPLVGSGWLAEGEIEGLASLVTKIELKSRGCFGQVWHARLSGAPDRTNCETDVAVKIFDLAHKESWDTELSLFRVPGLTHPHILKYYGADQVVNNHTEPPTVEFWIVTEYHALGSLHDHLKVSSLSWFELLRIATGVARGLSFLHSENVGLGEAKRLKPSIAHRDLNSRNVLLKSDLNACICDFGLAIRFEPGQLPSVSHPQLGTRRYMAPEVLDGAIQFSRDAYLRIDVYAMGLVFWELMSRCRGTEDARIEVNSPYRAPFELELGPSPTIADLERYVAREKRRPQFNPAWADYPSMCAFWETIEECWDQDAEARLSAGCVSERLSSLMRQPWSGRLLFHGPSTHASHPTGLHTQSFSSAANVGSERLTQSALASYRPIQTSPISFPVPSTCAPSVVGCVNLD